MTIVKNTVVSLAYEMYDQQGQLLDKTAEHPMQYLHGGYDGIFPLVEEALQGKSAGDTVEVNLAIDDAFGERDEELVRVEPKDAFPEEVSLGMMFETDDPETGDILYFTVTQIEGNQITIDANHPLAGHAIRFVAKVLDVRPASGEEVKHGHVHGPHGHHH